MLPGDNSHLLLVRRQVIRSSRCRPGIAPKIRVHSKQTQTSVCEALCIDSIVQESPWLSEGHTSSGLTSSGLRSFVFRLLTGEPK